MSRVSRMWLVHSLFVSWLIESAEMPICLPCAEFLTTRSFLHPPCISFFFQYCFYTFLNSPGPVLMGLFKYFSLCRLEKWDSFGARAGICLSGIGFCIKANHLEAKLRLIGGNCGPTFLLSIQFDKSVGKELLGEIGPAILKTSGVYSHRSVDAHQESAEWGKTSMQSKPSACSIDTTKM